MSNDKLRIWVHDFKEGRVEVYDEQTSGRPSISTIEVLAKVEDCVRDDHRFY